MRQTIGSTTALVLLTLAAGCARKDAAPAPAAPAKTASGARTASQQAPPPQAPASVTGTVLETMDAAGYTYLRLKTNTGEIWAAVNQSVVAKGSEVTVLGAMPMDGFESKTLNRKFDHIVFGTLGSKEGAAPAGGGDPMAAASHGAPAPGADPQQGKPLRDPHAGASTAPVDLGPIDVKKAEGKDGRTVAQVFAEKASLKDAAVSIRGKVVKFNGGIMGRNWIHLRDGSGSADKHDDDIVVTTTDPAAVGDVVLVKGVVHLDRDFGMGYSYKVLVEDAKVSK